MAYEYLLVQKLIWNPDNHFCIGQYLEAFSLLQSLFAIEDLRLT